MLAKNTLTPLAKSILILLGLTTAASAANESARKYQFGNDNIHNFKQRNGRYRENS